MLTCKNCNALFKPKPGQAAVASGLVLCPTCEARFAGDEGAPAAAAPAAAPRRAGTTSSATRPAAAPAGRASGVSAGRASSAGGKRAARERDAAPTDEALNPEAKFGLKIAIPLLIVAACVIGYAVVKNNERAAEEEAYAQKVTRFIADFRAMDLNDPTKAAEAIARAKAEYEAWSGATTEGEVRSLLNKAEASVRRGAEQKETRDALAAVESALQNASKLKAEELAEVKQKINRLEFEIQSLGDKGAVDRLTAAKKSIGQVYAEALYNDAKSMGSSGAAGVAALLKFKKAEDEALNLYSDARKANDEAGSAQSLELYKKIIADSDTVAATAYDAAAIKAVAARDLLANSEVSNWAPTEVEGFSHAIKGGALTIVGPDKSAKKRALMAIGDSEKWRDFVIDMVVQRSEGSVTFCCRLGKDYDANTPQFTLDQEALPTDKSMHATITCIGGKLQFQLEGSPNPNVDIDLAYTYSRKGAFAIMVPAGARIKFTTLTARVLR